MRRALGLLIVLAAALPSAARVITLEDRVAAQRAIEEVYWRHRIWPKDNPDPKPSLDTVMPARALRAKVEDSLKKSSALAALWHRPITGDQLQAELDRMAKGSRDTQVLRELFDALGNDPLIIAETLVRPALAERLVRNWHEGEVGAEAATSQPSKPTFDAWWQGERMRLSDDVSVATFKFTLPSLPTTNCTNDTWTATLTEVPDGRYGHAAVWTGTEMIVWGGGDKYGRGMNTGGRYNPATDTWMQTSTGPNTPPSAVYSTAVWTGTEMIVWGGAHIDESTGYPVYLMSGARYNPLDDSWTPTAAGTNAPDGRSQQTAVWTGTEMIIWGGFRPGVQPPGGGRYRPATNSWAPMSTVDAPPQLFGHQAVWTGTEMITWGGFSYDAPGNIGGRYNPITDTWTPTSVGANVPSPRSSHTAIWTGTELIIWGGSDICCSVRLNSGARYSPSTDSWTPTSLGTNVPPPRSDHSAVWTGSKLIIWGGSGGGASGATYDPATDAWTPTAATTVAGRSQQTAVWTGSEMIVWGGSTDGGRGLNTGARYNPTTDSWVTTSTGATVPTARLAHTAVWTGSEMIIWGGQPWGYPPTPPGMNSGGRYLPATDSWVPTSLGAGVPDTRVGHSAVWTGREMIVWGGTNAAWLNTGGRYNPIADSWTATSTGGNVPPPLVYRSAVWTGTEMIVQGDGNTPAGGRYDPDTDSWRAMAPAPHIPSTGVNTPSVWTGTEMIIWVGGVDPGGRYNPSTDSWATISTGANAPGQRYGHALVWTGTEMIAWGGGLGIAVTTGGRYDPSTDTWSPTSVGANIPSARFFPTAVWTGDDMVVWGGGADASVTANGGGRYTPSTDTWSPISMGENHLSPRSNHTAIWTGTEMIVWGGDPGTATGARYCACPMGRLFYRDADGDGLGNPGVSSASCSGVAPIGYVFDHADCNDAIPNAGSDFDNDGVGDACDLDDGLIYEWRNDKTSVSWQAEQGATSWNVYVGDLDVLKAMGVYTQAPGSNALAARQCGVTEAFASETSIPAPGRASFSLVTSVIGGVEGSLGSSGTGPRPNASPCP